MNLILFFIFIHVAYAYLNAADNNKDDVCTSCNQITLPLTKLGQKCYYIETITTANWFDANHFCNFHGMRLAIINSVEENDLLGSYIKTLGLPTTKTQRIWTSGHNLGGQWYWMSTGARLKYSNWAYKQPDNAGGNEHCLDVSLHATSYKLQWNDLPCTSWIIPFICEAYS